MVHNREFDKQASSLFRRQDEWIRDVSSHDKSILTRSKSRQTSILLSNSDLFKPTILSTSPHSHYYDEVDSPSVDPYKVLGLKRDATFDQIHKAYLRLSLLNHPHRFHSQLEKKEFKIIRLRENIIRWKFIVIAASYETLSDVDCRSNYDLSNKEQFQWNRQRSGSYTLWNDIKNGLKISDSFEEKLDHDGVQCCYYMRKPEDGNGSMICSQRNDSYSERLDKLRSRPSMLRDTSENSDVGTCDSSRAETSNLFGGQLRKLYKARNHEPFTEAFALFERETKSALYREDAQTMQNNFDDNFQRIAQHWLIANPASKKTSIQKQSIISPNSNLNDSRHSYDFNIKSMGKDRLEEEKKGYPQLPHLPPKILRKLCEESSPILDNPKDVKVTKTIENESGNVVEITTRRKNIGSDVMVRTEKITIDRCTGQKRKTVEVKRQARIEDDGKNRGIFSSCLPDLFDREDDDDLTPQYNILTLESSESDVDVRDDRSSFF